MTRRTELSKCVRRSCCLVLLVAASVISVGQLSADGTARRQDISVRNFGARGDARMLLGCSIKDDLRSMFCSRGQVSHNDARKTILIVGAGSRGAPLETKITSVSSDGTLVLVNGVTTAKANVDALIGRDDSDSVQMAINAAGRAGGGVIHFPQGVYRIGRTLRIENGNVRLTGVGENATLYDSSFKLRPEINAHTKTGNVLLPGGWSLQPLVTIGSDRGAVDSVEIDHLRVTGPHLQWVQASIGQALISTAPDNPSWRVSNFKLHNMDLDAYTLNGYSNGGILEGFDVRDNVMKQIAKEGIYLSGRARNGLILGNRLSTSLVNSLSPAVAIALKEVSNLRIERNVILGSFNTCIGGYVFPKRDVSITDNRCSLSGGVAKDGIYFDHGVHVRVSNNTIEGAGAFGITFRGPDESISDVSIEQNSIINGRGGPAISITGGLDRNNGPRNVIITGNKLIDNDSGIEAVNLKGKSSIRENNIKGRGIPSCKALRVKAHRDGEVDCADNRILNCQGRMDGCR